MRRLPRAFVIPGHQIETYAKILPGSSSVALVDIIRALCISHEELRRREAAWFTAFQQTMAAVQTSSSDATSGALLLEVMDKLILAEIECGERKERL
ncbi:hypothetical protein [Schlesneria paludicola]|uniref:hypothetical protein n=1 Tax=Schlesneria paludicola TaxID=360056 RepID=UPI00029A0342|nr:hypothetical protein [Schlesneria paludicola]